MPWSVIVEKNNRISHNDRLPLVSGWDFCHYLAEYRKPDAPVYCITSITEEKRLGLTKSVALPDVFACNDLYKSMHGVRMWMSRGNTTSSQHFDTHDNLMLQIDGTKDVYLSHPNESAAMYMDHHDKYGLSPINMDRVDLDRFPKMAEANVILARLTPGDALYIPDGWWHVIRSHERNIALAFEFVPRRNGRQPWTRQLSELSNHPGVFWSEKRKLTAAVHKAWYEQHYGPSATSTLDQCTAPLEQPPANLAEYPGWHGPRN